MNNFGRKAARGFSLLELVAVAGITVLIAAMATPRILVAMETVRLRSAANSVAGVLQNTRMAAVKSNSYYTAALQTVVSGGGTYRIVFADLNGNGTYTS